MYRRRKERSGPHLSSKEEGGEKSLQRGLGSLEGGGNPKVSGTSPRQEQEMVGKGAHLEGKKREKCSKSANHAGDYFFLRKSLKGRRRGGDRCRRH